MYIITREINQYDQDGEYFVAAFINKPTKDWIINNMPQYINAEHLLNGGGREEYESEWYYLREFMDGEIIKE